jgi:hypothetical protein
VRSPDDALRADPGPNAGLGPGLEGGPSAGIRGGLRAARGGPPGHHDLSPLEPPVQHPVGGVRRTGSPTLLLGEEGPMELPASQRLPISSAFFGVLSGFAIRQLYLLMSVLCFNLCFFYYLKISC